MAAEKTEKKLKPSREALDLGHVQETRNPHSLGLKAGNTTDQLKLA